MRKGVLNLKVFSLIFLTDILESCTQLLFKRGALDTGIINVTLSNFPIFVTRLLSSWNLWVGVFFYVLNFFLWMAVLFQVDLSVAYPVGSTSHIIVPLLAVLFVGEKISLLRWSGISLIIVGIYFIQRSTRPQTDS